MSLFRYADEDAEIGGHRVPAGAKVQLGAPFARMQTCVALEQLSVRLPGLRLAPGQEITFRPDLRTRLPDRLMVEW